MRRSSRARRPKFRKYKHPVLSPKVPEDPCRKHPGWERLECAHCGYRRSVNGVRREFMSAAERKEIKEKTGHDVESTSDVRRVYAQTGMREAEKGEDCYELFDALKDHAETGAALDHKHTVAGMDVFGDSVRRPNEKFDFRQRYLEHKHRLGRNG